MCSPLDRLVEQKYFTYENYLKSDHWRGLKAQYKVSGLPQNCTVCGTKNVDMHHKTYVRLGNERLQDLEPLCRKHHEEKHEKAKKWMECPCNGCGKQIKIKTKYKDRARCRKCAIAAQFDENGRQIETAAKRWQREMREELKRIG